MLQRRYWCCILEPVQQPRSRFTVVRHDKAAVFEDEISILPGKDVWYESVYFVSQSLASQMLLWSNRCETALLTCEGAKTQSVSSENRYVTQCFHNSAAEEEHREGFCWPQMLTKTSVSHFCFSSWIPNIWLWSLHCFECFTDSVNVKKCDYARLQR